MKPSKVLTGYYEPGGKRRIDPVLSIRDSKNNTNTVPDHMILKEFLGKYVRVEIYEIERPRHWPEINIKIPEVEGFAGIKRESSTGY